MNYDNNDCCLFIVSGYCTGIFKYHVVYASMDILVYFYHTLIFIYTLYLYIPSKNMFEIF